MEKSRKSGQNGKGSKSRISNKKKFDSNYNEIDWSEKEFQVVFHKDIIYASKRT